MGVYERCKEPVECEVCSTKWKEVDQSDPNNSLNRYLCYLRDIIKSQTCPNCGITIYKAGGCMHMLCQKCNFEFCWMCLGPYPNYVHTEWTACPLKFLVTLFMIFGMIFILDMKLSYIFEKLS